MITYASDVALQRVITASVAAHWLRFQWLGIALLPAASYSVSLAVLQTTNYRIRRRRWVGLVIWGLGLISALDALFGVQIVDGIRFDPPHKLPRSWYLFLALCYLFYASPFCWPSATSIKPVNAV